MKKIDKLFYNGKWQNASGTEFLKVINPATEEVIGEVIKSNHEDVDRAVAAAKQAFPSWSATSPEERSRYIERVLEILERRKEELAQTIVAELGVSIKFSSEYHVPLSIREIKATLEELKGFTFEEEIDNVTVVKEGFGVIACITPWNYPFNQIQRKITPALLTGNTVVVKPASDTPLSAILYAEIMEEAGLPAGVFNLVTGSGSEAGDYLAEHADVDAISFTGSTDVGKGLYAKAAPTVKKMILELGGKSAMIYLKGGDLGQVVHLAAGTALDNQGQSCSALTRLLVPSDELERTKQVLKEYYATILVGDPTDSQTRVGPLVSKKQLETVLGFIEKGKAEGAEVLIGGNKIEGKGFFVEPTVFVNVTNDMTIARKEIFGPVLSVITYDSVEEAIAIANDSDYGLAGGVVGPEEEAIQVARRMRTGGVFVNGGFRSPKAPFGGYKQSGIGRENGRYALEDAVEIKAIYK